MTGFIHSADKLSRHEAYQTRAVCGAQRETDGGREGGREGRRGDKIERQRRKRGESQEGRET